MIGTHRPHRHRVRALPSSCFVAHSDIIEPTQEWLIQIEIALSSCDALVALLHPEFHDSGWTDQEIGYAMGRGVQVYAIRFGQDPYEFIGRFQAFSASAKSPPHLARELFDAFRKNKETQARMTDVLVSLFESSTRFAEPKERIGYLEEVGTWDPAYSTRLRAATRQNKSVDSKMGALINPIRSGHSNTSAAAYDNVLYQVHRE